MKRALVLIALLCFAVPAFAADTEKTAATTQVTTEAAAQAPNVTFDDVIKQMPTVTVSTESLKALHTWAQEIPTKYGLPLTQFVERTLSDALAEQQKQAAPAPPKAKK